MVRKWVDGSKGGYYSAIESDDYAETSEPARMLQTLIDPYTAARAERERLQKIDALRPRSRCSPSPATSHPSAGYRLDAAIRPHS